MNAGSPYATNTYYAAATDGFVIANLRVNPSKVGGGFGYVKSYSTNYIAKQSREDSENISFMFPCKKGDEWKVSTSEIYDYKIYWIPFGT